MGWPGDAAMTAWFKRSQPKPQPVVSLDPGNSTAPLSPETDAEFLARIEPELRPQCACPNPAVRVVLIHNLDHCDDGPMPTFVCEICEPDVYRFIDDTLACVHKFNRWACKTCGGPVAALHDLIEDVVKL